MSKSFFGAPVVSPVTTPQSGLIFVTALFSYTGKVVPEEALDQYEEMKGKLGTNPEIEKMTRGFVRLAKKVGILFSYHSPFSNQPVFGLGIIFSFALSPLLC